MKKYILKMEKKLLEIFQNNFTVERVFIEQEKENQKVYLISTPFMDLANDCIEFYFVEEESKYFVTDDFSCSALLDEELNDKMKSIQTQLPIKNLKGEIVCDINKEKIEYELLLFLQYLIILMN